MKQRKGFTLMETVVVVGLLSILILLIVGIFIANSRFYRSQRKQTALNNESRQAGDRINEYVRLGESFLTSYTYNSQVYTAGADTLIVQVPSLDSMSEIIAGSSDIVIVALDPGDASRLILVTDADPTSTRTDRTALLAENVQSVDFSYDSPDIASAMRVNYIIDLLDSGEPSGNIELSGGVRLRN